MPSSRSLRTCSIALVQAKTICSSPQDRALRKYHDTWNEIVMKIYIVRHGKTEWNKLKKMQGVADIPLNEEGIERAYKTKN